MSRRIAMNDQAAQDPPAGDGDAPLARAKVLILKKFGARRVAVWCGVDPLTVYQWLQRGTDEKPIPTKHVPAILAGAQAAGLGAPIAVLWPAMGVAAETQP
jgi:hypothetical protein